MPLRSIASLPRLLGRQGAEAPTGPAPVIDRARVEGLVRLSLAGLEAMHDPARELLFSVTLEEGDQPVRVEHLGVRYTVMSSLGIHDARQAGFATTLDPIRLLQSGLDQHPGDDIDHLGMALWADADVGAGISKAVVPRLLAALDKPLDGVIGRAVSWALIGLCRYREQAGADARVDAAARRLRDHGLAGWHEAGGLFNHFAGGSAFLRTQALFSTQIYWVYALATHGRVFGDAEALRVAGKCADTLIALRDPFGGWPWRYDAPRGRVTERYPVYSVHQDAMAPMALHVLAEATGREVAAVNRESLAWL
ncbi:MAG: hypothetical protein KC620_23205, partial [Myxococcales bacterium]|nr:hypothetical protein [Myxococcales bacterium]